MATDLQYSNTKRQAGVECKPGKIAEVVNDPGEVRPAKRMIKTNTVPELATLYRAAEPIQRGYMLLGLTCGFIAAMLADLLLNEISLSRNHPYRNGLELTNDRVGNWIARFRGKTEVYGTWVLWPETVGGTNWWLSKRSCQTTLILQLCDFNTVVGASSK